MEDKMNNSKVSIEKQAILNDQMYSIKRYFKKFNIGSMLNKSGIKKTKGVSPLTISMSIFALPFIGLNFFRGLVTGQRESFRKDAAYDLLKCPNYNWRKLLLLIGVKLVCFFSLFSSAKRIKVLIFDDSTYERARSKSVELLAKVYDHADHKFIRGFRMLTACWSDGGSTVPLDFALLSSAKKEKRYQGITKKLDKRTCGYKRRQEALTKATDLVVSMTRRIFSYRIKFDYILMDSWFCWPKIISALHQYAPVICMTKKTPKMLYDYRGHKRTLNQIYRMVKKRPGKAKILANVIVKLSTGTSVKLVFVRDRHKKDWLALLSSDIDLSDEDIVQLYGRRWDIEVFFKMAKQHLKLVKEIQARDYDSLIAHTTIVFMRYQFLAYEQRIRTDNRTFGDLFYACSEEIKDVTFLEALYRILSLAVDRLRKVGEFSEAAYRTMIDAVMGEAIRYFGLGQPDCQRTQAVI